MAPDEWHVRWPQKQKHKKRPRQLYKGGRPAASLPLSVSLSRVEPTIRSLTAHRQHRCCPVHPLVTSQLVGSLDRSGHGDATVGLGVHPRPRRGAVGGHGDGLPGARVRTPRPRRPGGVGTARVPGLAPRRRRPVPVARARPAPGPPRALHALGPARRRLRAPLRRAPLLPRGLPPALRLARARLRPRRRAPAAPRRPGRRARPHFPPLPPAAAPGDPAADVRRRGAAAGPHPAVATAGAPGARVQAVLLLLLPGARRAAGAALPGVREPQDLGSRQARGRGGAGAVPAQTPLPVPRPLLPAQGAAARDPRRLQGPAGVQRAVLRRLRRKGRGGAQARGQDPAVRRRWVQAGGRRPRRRWRVLRLFRR